MKLDFSQDIHGRIATGEFIELASMISLRSVYFGRFIERKVSTYLHHNDGTEYFSIEFLGQWFRVEPRGQKAYMQTREIVLMKLENQLRIGKLPPGIGKTKLFENVSIKENTPVRKVGGIFEFDFYWRRLPKQEGKRFAAATKNFKK